MNKKQGDVEQDSGNESVASSSASPARSSGSKRKSASHSSAKRERAKSASRKGNATGGIHQRGDKRVVR